MKHEHDDDFTVIFPRPPLIKGGQGRADNDPWNSATALVYTVVLAVAFAGVWWVGIGIRNLWAWLF